MVTTIHLRGTRPTSQTEEPSPRRERTSCFQPPCQLGASALRWRPGYQQVQRLNARGDTSSDHQEQVPVPVSRYIPQTTEISDVNPCPDDPLTGNSLRPLTFRVPLGSGRGGGGPAVATQAPFVAVQHVRESRRPTDRLGFNAPDGTEPGAFTRIRRSNGSLVLGHEGGKVAEVKGSWGAGR
jgi:hypothetical protein